MKRHALMAVVLAVTLVAASAAPALALGGASTPAAVGTSDVTDHETTDDGRVNVSVGQQLSTVLAVSSDEVRTDFEAAAFELSVATGDDEVRAEILANRSAELRERTATVVADYEAAREAYHEGEIDRSTYAQRLATLNARATNLLDGYERFHDRAATVSALELRAAGVDRAALAAAVDDLDVVTGPGTAALRARFTAESEREVRFETADGRSIRVESEDGEYSRELERPGDDDANFTVTQGDALVTARDALSAPPNGSWALTAATVRHEYGEYEFAFALRGADATGEAEVTVDGSAGTVVELEEEVEREADERENDREDAELALVVADGTPAPNATVTLRALVDGAPAANVTVTLNDRVAGTTGPNGTLTVTLPAAGEADLRAERGEAEAELEFEFDDAADRDRVVRALTVDATLDDRAVTVTVGFDGSAVANATVYADERRVGTTDADGTVRFTLDDPTTEDVELTVVKGAFEAELRYDIRDGALVLTEGVHEVEEDDEREDEEDERDDESEDEREDADDEREDEDADDADDDLTATPDPEDEDDEDDEDA
jgi:hypothetical protein